MIGTGGIRKGEEALDRWITGVLEELRTATLLCGCRSVAQLRAVPRVTTRETRRRLDDPGYPASG